MTLLVGDPDDWESIKSSLPINKYNIKKYSLGAAPLDQYNYIMPFCGYDKFRNKIEHVEIIESPLFDKLVSFINEDENLINAITHQDIKYTVESELECMLIDIARRYLYVTHATKDVPDNFEKILSQIVVQKINFIFLKELKYQLCIPLSLVTFSENRIKLSDTIRITRIDDDIQKARQIECNYESNIEGWVSASATHMLVIDCKKNNHIYQPYCITKALKDYSSPEIDALLGAIRIVSECIVGYEQVFIIPDNWFYSFEFDLPVVYATPKREINPKVLKKDEIELTFTEFSHSQIEQIKELYLSLIKCSEIQGGNKNIFFAATRFNRCMLREELDDKALDATVGLEALLTDGSSKNEITFTISSRIPIVFRHIKNSYFTPLNSRSIMKKIYAYRSKIVHGKDLNEKDKRIEINKEKHDIPDVATEFLRYTLLFVLKYPEFQKASYFDEYVDKFMNL